MAPDPQLAEFIAGKLRCRQVDFPAAEQAAQRVRYLDVDQRRRVNIAEHRSLLHFGGFAEQVRNDGGRINYPAQLRRPDSRASRMSAVVTPLAPRLRMRSSSSSGVGA